MPSPATPTEPAPPPPPVVRLTYKLPEVARMFGVSEEHIRRLARAGEMPGAIGLGRRLVFNRKAIDALAAGTSAPVAHPAAPATTGGAA